MESFTLFGDEWVEMNITYITLRKNVVYTIHSICWSLGISACQAMMYQCVNQLHPAFVANESDNRCTKQATLRHPQNKGMVLQRVTIALFIPSDGFFSSDDFESSCNFSEVVLQHYLLNAKKCDQQLVLLKSSY